MGKATDMLELEQAIERIHAGEHTERMTTDELIRHMDLMVSAARAVVVRRLEREVRPYSLPRRFPLVNDPGLEAINRCLEMIAERVGYKRDESVEMGAALEYHLSTKRHPQD